MAARGWEEESRASSPGVGGSRAASSGRDAGTAYTSRDLADLLPALLQLSDPSPDLGWVYAEGDWEGAARLEEERRHSGATASSSSRGSGGSSATGGGWGVASSDPGPGRPAADGSRVAEVEKGETGKGTGVLPAELVGPRPEGRGAPPAEAAGVAAGPVGGSTAFRGA